MVKRNSTKVSRSALTAARVSLIYALFAGTWIVASDSLLALVLHDTHELSTAQTYKGLVFVAVTAALVFLMVRSVLAAALAHQMAQGEAPPRLGLATALPAADSPLAVSVPILAFLLLAAATVTAGYIAYESERRAIIREKREDLLVLSQLKASQIAQWLQDRREDGLALTRSPSLAKQAERWLDSGAPAGEARQSLLGRLVSLTRSQEYRSAALYDAAGKLRLYAGIAPSQERIVERTARSALESGKVALVDLHRVTGQGPPRAELGILAPLIASAKESPHAVAAVYLAIDPALVFYPLVQTWPTASPSAEVLLVRHDGDRVLFLNELRHRHNTALVLSKPRADPELPAAMAVRGKEGVVEGRDYRGRQVLAGLRKVPDSPWYLVAKIDSDEIFASIRALAWSLGLLIAVFLGAAGTAVLLWWRHYQSRSLVRHYRAALERQALVAHADYLAKYANDIILLMDEHGAIMEANDRAVAAYGYGREELSGLNARNLRAPQSLVDLDTQWQRAASQDGAMYETIHRRRDDRTFPVEVSLRRLEVEGAWFYQAIIRDISERKAAQQRIERLNALYATLSEANQAIVRTTSRAILLQEVCRIAVTHGHFRMAWIGMIDAGGHLTPVAVSGADQELLDQLLVAGDAHNPCGCGPAHQAVHAGSRWICNAFPTPAMGERCRAVAGRAGLRAAASLALQEENATVGILSVYAGETGFFDDEMVDLLAELAADISYALDNLARDVHRKAAEDALRESEQRFRELVETTNDWVWEIDGNGLYTYASPKIRELLGYTPEEMLGKSPLDFMSPPESRHVRERFESSLSRREPFRLLVSTCLHKAGHPVVLETSGTPIFNANGVFRGYRGIDRDITARVEAESQLLLWSKVLEHSAEGIMITDAANNILTINKAFTQVTGYSSAEVRGRNPRILKSERQDEDFYRTMWSNLTRGGHWQGEIWNRRKNGEVYPEWLSITTVRDDEGVLLNYVGIFYDITERKAADERIQYLAHYDAVTGLPNRLLFHARLEQAMASAKRHHRLVALLFLDIDHFKDVNDSLGHASGDLLLKAFGERLKDAVRGEDTVARLGGDELVVVACDLASAQDAAQVANTLFQAMSHPIVIGGHEIPVTASVGISVYPHDATDSSSLMRNADAAMYHAKELGRNNYQFYNANLDGRLYQALAMESGLRLALERGEFVLHYQPQVDIATGRFVGTEALLRWEHPELGLLPPARFISVAEERGLMVAIGEWVLRSACAQNRHWQKAGLPCVPVAVNISGVQFRQPDLPDMVARVLRETDLDPQYLDLELTESAVMTEAEAVVAAVGQLKALGVHLSIDDFGTGHSALSYLRPLPIDKLKIDRSFVRDIATSPEAAAITSVTISLAKSLNLKVAAEGVETAQQLALLREQQCDEAQGYHFSAPLPAPELAALVRDWTAVAGSVER